MNLGLAAALTALITLAPVPAAGHESEAPALERGFLAGAYAADITPEFPISMNGGMTDRTAKYAHDRLHARCLVLADGRTKLAIAVCDSCMIPRELVDAAKESASKATGIRTDHMLIAATHTHTAPTLGGVFQSEPDVGYQRFLIRRIAAGIEKANKQIEPARIGWGVACVPNHVFNRRWFMKDGSIDADPFGRLSDRVKMNPPRAGANLLKPAGPVDPAVSIIAVEALDRRPIAVLANYSLHYVGGVPPDAVSADYFGEFAEQIKQRLGATRVVPPFVGIMSNGTSGDINNINFRVPGETRKPFEQIRIVAADMVNATYAAYGRIKFHDETTLGVRERDINLRVRMPTPPEIARAQEILASADKPVLQTLPEVYARETVLLAKYPQRVPVKLQALRIGEVGIAAIPCEVFVEVGLAIKRLSPFTPTFTIELANGYNGYLPTPEQHRIGGYETWRARSSFLEVEASTKITTVIKELFAELAK